jgi:hypothetical protein
MNNIKKMGTILAVFAMIASTLLVSMPVGAAIPKGTDLGIVSVTLPGTQPALGDNISLTAMVRAGQAAFPIKTATNDTWVNFTAVNGSNLVVLSSQHVIVGQITTTAWQFNSSWDSTKIVPDTTKNWAIRVTAWMKGKDVFLGNNTLNSTDGATPKIVHWRTPNVVADKIKNATTGNTYLIGDAYTAIVTVNNTGDADYKGVQDVLLKVGTTTVGKVQLNTTVTALAPATTKDLTFVVNATTTGTFTAAVKTMFTVIVGGVTKTINVTFIAKTTGVYPTELAFDPLTNVVKGTQTVNITATFKNMGTMNAVNFTAITFSVNGTDITTGCINTAIKVSIVNDNTTTATTWCKWVTTSATKKAWYVIEVVADNGAPGKAKFNTTLTVLPTPHTVLGITSITFTPTTLVQKDDAGMKQNLTISVIVANTGDKDATNAALTVKVGSDTLTNNTVNVKIAGTATVVFTEVVTTAKDDFLLNVTADFVLGTDKATKNANISVPGHKYRPNYAVTAITALPAGPIERGLTGAPINITVTVKNTGDNKDKTTLTVKLTTKLGTAAAADLTTLTIKGVVAGGTNTTSYLWNVPSTFPIGSYVIDAFLDGITPLSHVNTTYAIIEYKKPVLSVDFAKDTKGKIKSYSSSAADGKTATLNVVVIVSNAATATAAGNTIYITLTDASGKVVGSAWYNTSIAPGGTSGEIKIPIKVKAGASAKLTANIASAKGIHNDAVTGTASPLPASASVKKTPGFEVVILVGAVFVALVILYRRKK